MLLGQTGSTLGAQQFKGSHDACACIGGIADHVGGARCNCAGSAAHLSGISSSLGVGRRDDVVRSVDLFLVQGAAGAVSVKAPMPGNILDVKVAAGASVKAGDVLVILEAMKMENEIVAPQDGTVASVNVHKGDTVNSGDTLVSMN